MSRSKFCAALAAAVSIAMAMSLAGPSDARADRCNPDEMAGPVYTMVTGQPYEPVFGHDDGPFCYAMRTVVYPAIGCDPVYQSLQDCILAQPRRALEIYSGLCNETASEFYDVYDRLPDGVRRYLQATMDGISFNCG